MALKSAGKVRSVIVVFTKKKQKVHYEHQNNLNITTMAEGSHKASLTSRLKAVTPLKITDKR